MPGLVLVLWWRRRWRRLVLWGRPLSNLIGTTARWVVVVANPRDP
jgi:hypothetical protein